jgi:hypothetical protein
MAKPKVATLSEMSNFNYDTSKYISLGSFAPPQKDPPKNPGQTPRRPEGKAKS